MSRIAETFQRLKSEGKTGLIAYLPVGFPDVEGTLDLVPAMVDGGADIVELGIPFSDPLADGATIQRSSQIALAQGVTLSTCMQVCKVLRGRLPLVPLIFMGYYNPILSYGLERFARDAEEAGADGVIVPDLPPEEAGSLLEACRVRGIDVIFLLAPTSTENRIRRVGSVASGFIYCVSLTGVTGSTTDLSQELPYFLQQVRSLVPTVPLAVGFGVSTREHVETIGSMAEAVIVGSAIVREIEESGDMDRVKRVRGFVEELSRGTQSHVRSR